MDTKSHGRLILAALPHRRVSLPCSLQHQWQQLYFRAAATFLSARLGGMRGHVIGQPHEPIGCLLGEIDATTEMHYLIREWRRRLEPHPPLKDPNSPQPPQEEV